MSSNKTLFSYKAGSDLAPRLVEWLIVEETAKGYWLVEKSAKGKFCVEKGGIPRWVERAWTSKTAPKRRAYDEKPQAFEAYLEECRTRVRVSRKAFDKARKMLKMAEELYD